MAIKKYLQNGQPIHCRLLFAKFVFVHEGNRCCPVSEMTTRDLAPCEGISLDDCEHKSQGALHYPLYYYYRFFFFNCAYLFRLFVKLDNGAPGAEFSTSTAFRLRQEIWIS